MYLRKEFQSFQNYYKQIYVAINIPFAYQDKHGESVNLEELGEELSVCFELSYCSRTSANADKDTHSLNMADI